MCVVMMVWCFDVLRCVVLMLNDGDGSDDVDVSDVMLM